MSRGMQIGLRSWLKTTKAPSRQVLAYLRSFPNALNGFSNAKTPRRKVRRISGSLRLCGFALNSKPRRFASWLPVIAVLVVILNACGGSGITQTSQTQRYQLQFTLDGLGFGQRTATVEIRDSGGQPVAADQVVLAPVMQQMGMASPEIVAQSVAPGRYQAQGEFFSMLGQWEVDVRVSAGGAEDVGRFIVQVDQP
jgi:hypothetical protein